MEYSDENYSSVTHTILIVEDDAMTRHFLTRILEVQGYKVVQTATGESGLTEAFSSQPDAVLLDLGLPDIEGLQVVRRLREWATMPIVILSLREHEQIKVEALDAGADDYLTKPFGVAELLARLRAALRRSGGAQSSETVFKLDKLCIDLTRRKVTLAEREVRLTPIEYNLLAALTRNAGQVVSHTQLLREVWGPQYISEKNYLRLYIKQLRDKLEDDSSNPRYLLTESGIGYRLKAQEHLNDN